MTGANFAVAETGGFVVCTNEGNADIGANLPELHIASIGIEKLIPAPEDLGVFIRMLSRSALGSPITQYTSHFHGPRTAGSCTWCSSTTRGANGSACADFWHALKCIRCGACMNTCPVYRRSGGLSYGATYSGPIGVILDPGFDLRSIASSRSLRRSTGRAPRSVRSRSTSTIRSTNGGRSSQSAISFRS